MPLAVARCGWITRGAGVLLVGGGALAAGAVVLRRFIHLGADSQWMVDSHSVRVFETVVPAGVEFTGSTEDGVLVIEPSR